MKKLLSVLAVAAIVTSAFAFNTRALGYCVLNNAGTACEVRQNVVEQTGTANASHFPFAAGKWNGTHAGCTGASIVTDCITPIKLIAD
jgi:hypothetical protein